MLQDNDEMYILRSNEKSELGSQFDVRQAPSPVQQMHAHYQLTFKKQGVGSYMFQSPKNNKSKMVTRQLFKLSKQNQEKLKKISISEFTQFPIEKMRQFPYQTLTNYCLNNGANDYLLKVKVLNSIYEVKCLRIKMVNAETNLNILAQLKTKSQQQIHKQYLFGCLVMQLRKKLFIEALKYNFYLEKYQRVSHNKQKGKMIEEESQSQSQEEIQKIKQVKNKYTLNEETGAKSLGSGREDARAIILNQVIQSIVKAQLYYAFKRIQCIQLEDIQKKQHFHQYISQNDDKEEEQYQAKLQHSQSELIYPLQSENKEKQNSDSKLQIEYSNQKFYENSGEMQESFQPEQEIEKLQNYIKSLLMNIVDDDSDMGIMKNYFIRWRIYFLRNVIKMIKNQMVNHDQLQDIRYQRQNMYSEQNLQEQDYQQNRLDTQKQSASAAESQISHTNNLKHEKKMLKNYIYKNQFSFFLEELHSYSAYNKIKRICKKIYRENLLKKAFGALIENIQDKYRKQQLQQYYEQIAEQQYQGGTQAQLFYKTNLVFQTFKHWKQNHKCLKMKIALQNIVHKLAFKKIKYVYLRGKYIDDKIARFLFYKQRKLIFKSFNCLKYHSETTGKIENLHKCKEHLAEKKHMIKQIIFNYLHLQVKNTKIQTIKAQRFWQIKQYKKIFMILYQHSICKKKDTIQNERRNYQLYCLFSKKFMNKMSQFYCQRQKYKQQVVIVAKMQQFIKIKRAKKMLIYWRKKHIKTLTYNAIQLRLARLVQKSNVERIYKIWKQQTQKKLEQKDNKQQSGHHSNWLKKYYANLCQFQR